MSKRQKTQHPAESNFDDGALWFTTSPRTIDLQPVRKLRRLRHACSSDLLPVHRSSQSNTDVVIDLWQSDDTADSKSHQRHLTYPCSLALREAAAQAHATPTRPSCIHPDLALCDRPDPSDDASDDCSFYSCDEGDSAGMPELTTSGSAVSPTDRGDRGPDSPDAVDSPFRCHHADDVPSFEITDDDVNTADVLELTPESQQSHVDGGAETAVVAVLEEKSVSGLKRTELTAQHSDGMVTLDTLHCQCSLLTFWNCWKVHMLSCILRGHWTSGPTLCCT